MLSSIKHIVFEMFNDEIERKYYFNTKEEANIFMNYALKYCGNFTKFIYYGKEIITSNNEGEFLK